MDDETLSELKITNAALLEMLNQLLAHVHAIETVLMNRSLSTREELAFLKTRYLEEQDRHIDDDDDGSPDSES